MPKDEELKKDAQAPERDPFKKRLTLLQCKFRSPKDLVNEFGGFKFRNAEQMCDALKPLSKEFEMLITADETIVGGGQFDAPGRVYARVTVTAEDWYTGETRKASAWAREMEHKTKMDDSQVSGLALSYAFKYALGLLLLVGTERDADSMQPEAPKPITAAEALQVYRVSWTAYKQRTGKDKDAIAADVAQAMGRTVDAASDVKTLLDAAAWLDAQGVANEG